MIVDAPSRIVLLAHRDAHPDPLVERVRREAAAAAWREGMDAGLSGEALQRAALHLYCAAVGVPCPAALTLSDEVIQ